MSKLFALNHERNVLETTQYVLQTFKPEDSILSQIKTQSAKNGLPEIQVASMDGLHLEVFTRMISPQRAVEIGTLGGYSGTCIARGLSPTGHLHTFELSPEQAEVARANFTAAGVSEKITIHVGIALNNLRKIEHLAPFDMVFIDADKTSYPAYARWANLNIRKGGVLIADNTFAFGNVGIERVSNPDMQAASEAMREFNAYCSQSGNFKATILPTFEGITVAVKI